MKANLDTTEKQTSKTAQREPRREQGNLSVQYGSIGIEAVAAAMRYAGSGKNPAYAPAVHRIDERLLESAV